MLGLFLNSLYLAVGILLAWSGLEKLTSFQAFQRGLADYQLIPAVVIRPAAATIAMAELIAAGLLFSAQAPRVAGTLGAILLGSYTIALGIQVAKHRTIPCHCFGSSPGERVSVLATARAGLLFAMCVSYALAVPTVPDLNRPGSWLGTPLIAGSVAMFLRLLTLVPQTIDFLVAPARKSASRGRRVSFKDLAVDQPLKAKTSGQESGPMSAKEPVGVRVN